MSRKSRRELERELEKLREMLNDDNDDDITVHSQVATITADMVDDGNTIESEVPEPTAPDGHELGDVAPTDSPVVTVRELIEG